MSHSFTLLRTEDALKTWPVVESFLKKGLDEDQYTLLTTDDLRHAVRRGQMSLWHIHDDMRLVGAFITEHVRGSRGGAINIIVLGGSEMPMWIEDFTQRMTSYAKELRCLYVCEMGRGGWTRVLSRLGWIAPSSVMLKMAV